MNETQYRYELLFQHCHEVEAQRDELLVLLKSIYNDVVQGAIPNHGDECYEHARTAIAEAEGEQ